MQRPNFQKEQVVEEIQNVLIATREEVIERFLENNKKAIDVDVVEKEEEEDE